MTNKAWSCFVLFLVFHSQISQAKQHAEVSNDVRHTVEQLLQTMSTPDTISKSLMPQIALKNTFVDDLTSLGDRGHGAGVKRLFESSRILMVGLLLMTVLTIFSGMFGVIFGKTFTGHSSAHLFLGASYWGGWVSLGLFIIATLVISLIFNDVTLAVLGNLESIEDGIESVLKDINMLSVSSMSESSITNRFTQFGAQLLVSLNSALEAHLGTKKDGLTFLNQHHTLPVLCNQGWNEGNMYFNKYPPTTAIYDYNLRRIAPVETEDDPDLDYVRTLVLDKSYKGGMTDRMAKLFGAVSNECEAFHGDVESCCNADNCKSEPNPVKCLQQRCPGKVLEMKASNHCQCIEVFNKAGFQVEHQQISLCAAKVRDQVKRFVDEQFSQDQENAADRAVEAMLQGCAGTFDAAALTASDNWAAQAYSSGGFADSGAADPSDIFLQPQQSGTNDETATIEFTLTDCSPVTPTALKLFIVYTNDATEQSMEVFLDNLRARTVVLPAAPALTEWSEVPFTLPELKNGDHVISIRFGDTSALPLIRSIRAEII